MEIQNKPSKSSKEYTTLVEQDMKCCYSIKGNSDGDSSEGSSDRRKLMKRKRSNRVKRYKNVTANASSSLTAASISDDVIDEQEEEEEVALSLIILSGSCEFLKTSKSKKQSVLIPRKDTKKRKSQVDLETKSSVFECSVCKKGFPSYQALGGHRASHKKFNGCCAPLETESDEKKQVVSRVHECPICFKVFPSGQALGGHKRSHLAAKKPVCENRGYLDLNLPATGDDDEECSHVKAWWFEGGALTRPDLRLG